MSYQSERFIAPDLPGLERVWSSVDNVDLLGGEVRKRSEVMAGRKYRRQLSLDNHKLLMDVDYSLQVVFEMPERGDGKRRTLSSWQEIAHSAFVAMDLPAEPDVDHGALVGWNPEDTNQPLGTGDANTENLDIYSPWIQTRWSENGRTCMFFCGFEPPRPLISGVPFERLGSEWDEKKMRKGIIVFEPTPQLF